ncbi:GNAT family N-acetyltransferase [Mangrovibacter plantisponsor]|uniref:Acetyltransferase (GNAT) family protein n=1 Tax=Mangrovibacter plantisponsor TaxID=451513 RepID=A0A317Q3H9_9ENTR|nr:GNAT family N-acetyltransferase [Mangrovibacter plantisponsor]PWW10109.1 acetyltransferase (GNAT) family protein [Mangrovibacter plantisponsor]
MKARIFSLGDDLEKIISDINNASWDASNQIFGYSESALRNYLSMEGVIFLSCYSSGGNDEKLLGISSSRIEMKPYNNDCWLYIDEIDVCMDQRQKGVGKFIMQKLLQLAREHNCKEVWLGAESENHAANMLYNSMNPDEVSEIIGYSYRIKI